MKKCKLALSTGLVGLAIVFLTTTASAHFLGYSSVDAGEIRWGSSTKYTSARDHAISQWNALGKIYIAPDSAWTYEDVNFYDVYRSDVSWDGMYYNSVGADEIEFNSYYLDGYSLFKQQAVATHELGHALGLAHSYYGQIMYSCSTCSGVNTPQDHDRADYYALYP